ncbi:AGAP013455-PA-like protein [Anopheles sinensis]|uniref:AGAP013455-PA-like protein n=1 Tax=Anopheles sinensis TaxID=74873 RepID=A0A084W179_ANOSI|nr:AGAP013455-PA-like protein [Anopheles sinensis]
MQVAAATGQPLLAPNPLQMITTPYGPAIHTQPFQTGPAFHQQYRTIYDAPQPAPLQYLAATPPSTTPSPGQPHQQYHPGPQPSPAGGGPPTNTGLATNAAAIPKSAAPANGISTDLVIS